MCFCKRAMKSLSRILEMLLRRLEIGRQLAGKDASRLDFLSKGVITAAL